MTPLKPTEILAEIMIALDKDMVDLMLVGMVGSMLSSFLLCFFLKKKIFIEK